MQKVYVAVPVSIPAIIGLQCFRIWVIEQIALHQRNRAWVIHSLLWRHHALIENAQRRRKLEHRAWWQLS